MKMYCVIRERFAALVLSPLLLLAGGCQKESAGPDPNGADGALVISAKASEPGTDAENAIRTLRLFVFSTDDGTMLLNKMYKTADAAADVPQGSYTYFVNQGGAYRISEMLPKQNINVMLLANETAAMDGDYTMDQVRDFQLRYYNQYGSTDVMDVKITGTDNGADNRGYVPMFTEIGELSLFQWNAGNGRIVDMPLKRNLAKVALKLEAGAINDPAFQVGRDKITIKSASVVRIPQFSYVGDVSLTYAGPLISSATKTFSQPIETDGTTTGQTTDQLTFYVPEYVIAQDYADNGQYTYIQVNAEYYSADTGETISSVYKIPLGNGVNKLYDASAPADLKDLTREDFVVSRNTLYNVQATVSSKGTLQVFQVTVGIEPWTAGEDVNVDSDTPLLNVSNLSVDMSASKVRVYFWTNQANSYIEAAGKKNATADFDVNTVFSDLSGTAGANTGNFHIYAAGEDKQYPYNGYIDLRFADAATYSGDSDIYTLMLNAGGLRRSISVQANPVMGTIVFDANGGTTADGTGSVVHSVKYGELGGNALVGSTLSVADPQGQFTAPTGKAFLYWSYSKTGVPAVNAPTLGSCQVVPTGTTTTVYAIWN